MSIPGARIWFRGNPWPAGHGVKRAVWTGVLGADGLRFHFHVASDDYDADDDREQTREPDDDWKARIVWTNYGGCTLSSTKWGNPGFLVARPGKPIDLDKLAGKTLRVDPIEGDALDEDQDLEELAFGMYLLGHDTAVDHRIRLVRRIGPWAYDLAWRARIALTYAGDHDLEHTLRIELPKLRLDSIKLDPKLGLADARALLPTVLVGAKVAGRKVVRAARKSR